MTACQTLAKSLSATPLATSYPTTLFSLPPPYHYEVTDLSSYTLYLPSTIKCCVDRLSRLTKADKGGFWPAAVCPLLTHKRHGVLLATLLILTALDNLEQHHHHD